MKIKDYWQSVHGWFDFQDVYFTAVSVARPGDILVEIGSFVGKSTCFMLETIYNSNKKLDFYAVDLWDMYFMNAESNTPNTIMLPWNQSAKDWVETEGSDAMFKKFADNIKQSGYGEFLKGAIKENSATAARHFADKSVFFAFIDAGHSYESVNADIKAWYPKIKSGGFLAGHDYLSGDTIRRAVHELCKRENLKLNVYNNSWVVQAL